MAQTETTNQQLPKGWKLKKLPSIADLKNGGTPSKSNSSFWKEGNIPFVTAADLVPLYVNSARSYLTEEGLNSGKTVICRPGDVLIGTRTRVGNCSIAEVEMGASQDITRARIKEEMMPEYLCLFLRNIASYLAFYSQGTSIQGITRKILNDLEVPVPPPEDQKRIIKKIDEINAQMRDAHQIVSEMTTELEKLTPALLSKAFRGELQF